MQAVLLECYESHCFCFNIGVVDNLQEWFLHVVWLTNHSHRLTLKWSVSQYVFCIHLPVLVCHHGWWAVVYACTELWQWHTLHRVCSWLISVEWISCTNVPTVTAEPWSHHYPLAQSLLPASDIWSIPLYSPSSVLWVYSWFSAAPSWRDTVAFPWTVFSSHHFWCEPASRNSPLSLSPWTQVYSSPQP